MTTKAIALLLLAAIGCGTAPRDDVAFELPFSFLNLHADGDSVRIAGNTADSLTDGATFPVTRAASSATLAISVESLRWENGGRLAFVVEHFHGADVDPDAQTPILSVASGDVDAPTVTVPVSFAAGDRVGLRMDTPQAIQDVRIYGVLTLGQ